MTYFVTFRLVDSLPQDKLRELAALRDEWLQKVGRSSASSYEEEEQYSKDTMAKVERWLDEGMGSCLLREEWAAKAVERCLRHEDTKRYDLFAFVIMPNHVHLLARPYSDQEYPLERLEQAFKSFSAREINRRLGTQGTLWQQESFDRIVRDEEHLFRCLQYIGRNPQLAGLSSEHYVLYVREEWRLAGWTFQNM